MEKKKSCIILCKEKSKQEIIKNLHHDDAWHNTYISPFKLAIKVHSVLVIMSNSKRILLLILAEDV
jgi:hypothetical protein